MLSVILTHQLTSSLPATGSSEGGLQAAQSLTPAMHAAIAPTIAEAFGSTYWWALGLVVIAFIPSLFLPRHGSAVQMDKMRAAEEEGAEMMDVAMAEF
jgi:hypothetical protein